jgi:xylulokinase
VPLYLGLDSSTQSLSASVIDVDRDHRRVVFQSSIVFDAELPQYGTRHGVLPQADADVAVSPPLMWAEALDMMMERVSRSVDARRIAAISGSAQQHGSVYLNGAAATILAELDSERPLAEQLTSVLARAVSPIWMDSSTSRECAAITRAVGGEALLAQRTGSRAFERFTGPQIRKFHRTDPNGYAATKRIHLVSSFMASLLTGQHAPLDPGDASGMNVMDLEAQDWWEPAMNATAPGLSAKLPPIVPAWTIAGHLAEFWRDRYGFAAAKVVTWSGDNPCSLIGTGLVREGRLAISMGTSDTVFGLMREPRVDASGTGHVFGAPTGAYMGLTCFLNGSLARERVRDAYGFTWQQFSAALDATPPGNNGAMMLPWFEPEITPHVPTPGVRRFNLAEDDPAANVRAIVEAQQMAMALHSRWMGVKTDTIYATGGASANRQILQVMADVFDADVYQLQVSNSAALGAALRAFHGDRADAREPMDWDEVIRGFVEPIEASRVRPSADRHAIYAALMPIYSAHESEARAGGAAL